MSRSCRLKFVAIAKCVDIDWRNHRFVTDSLILKLWATATFSAVLSESMPFSG
jgi:hypothetical protein